MNNTTLYKDGKQRYSPLLSATGWKCLDEYSTIPKETQRDVLAETWCLEIKIYSLDLPLNSFLILAYKCLSLVIFLQWVFCNLWSVGSWWVLSRWFYFSFLINVVIGPCLVTQLCLTLCNPCSLPGSSVHGISQARILEKVVVPFSRGSSWPRDWNQISCIAGRFFTIWATREVQ